MPVEEITNGAALDRLIAYTQEYSRILWLMLPGTVDERPGKRRIMEGSVPEWWRHHILRNPDAPCRLAWSGKYDASPYMGSGDITLNYGTDARTHLHIMPLRQSPTITLCGPTRFISSYQVMMLHFSLRGFKVFVTGSVTHSDEELNLAPAMQEMLLRLHQEKIAQSDGIYVINQAIGHDERIGHHTIAEIRFARQLGIDIQWYAPHTCRPTEEDPDCCGLHLKNGEPI